MLQDPLDETGTRTRWFALSVVPRKEKVTAQNAPGSKGYEEFLPLYTERRELVRTA